MESMVLQAIFIDFNHLIIKDADLQRSLIDELLIAENLRPDPLEYAAVYFGQSDRACLSALLTRRGRLTSAEYLNKLLARKAERYVQVLSEQGRLTLYPGLEDFLYQIRRMTLPLVLVTAAQSGEVTWVLNKTQLTDQFAAVVTGSDLTQETEKPSPQAFEIALARVNQEFPERAITLTDCLAVEATYPGIEAAKTAGVPVVGVAHLYPYRMMQRRANWAVDYLNEIDLEWIQQYYARSVIVTPTS
jgi:beta-phosphoglucomutase-like phosphatase (HAD superfamily)